MKSFLLSFSFHCIIILCVFYLNKSFVDKSKNLLITNEYNLELFEIVNYSKIKITKNKEYKKIKTEVNKTVSHNKPNKITSISNKTSVINKSKSLNQPQSQSYGNKNVEIQKNVATYPGNTILKKQEVPLIKKSTNKVSIYIKNKQISISKKYAYSAQIYKKSLKPSFEKLNSCRVMKKSQNNLFLRKKHNSSLNDFSKININQLLNKNNKYNNLTLQKKININQLFKQNDGYNKLLFEKKINLNQLLYYQLNNSQSLFCSN